ncbi:hypothetical protein E3U43_005742, partial [Larimichthys crocea]
AVMFILNLVLLALLAVATAQSGSPQYIQGQWIVSDDSPQYEEVDGLAVQGRIWPARPPDVVELGDRGQESADHSRAVCYEGARFR